MALQTNNAFHPDHGFPFFIFRESKSCKPRKNPAFYTAIPRSQLPRQYRHIDHKIVLRFLKIQPRERLDPPQAVFHGILMCMEKFRCLIEVSGTAKISCKCIEELLTLHRF